MYHKTSISYLEPDEASCMLVNDMIHTLKKTSTYFKSKLQKNRKRKENLTLSTSSQAPPGTAKVVGAATCATDGGDLAGTGVDGQLIGTGTNGVLTRVDAGATTLEGDVVGDVDGEVEGSDMGEATMAGDVGLEGGVADNEVGVVAGDVDNVAKGE